VPSFDLDDVDWLSGLIRHLERPILTGPKLAVYVFEYLARDNSGLSSRSFIVRKFCAKVTGN
jgi:hypothetical protein